MRTIDGYWEPGRKKAEELLSDTPTMEEQEAFIMAKLDEIFENQVGDFTIFKAEMLDHFMLSLEEQTNSDSKEDFCKAYHKIYKELGGALMVRSMGYHSMHMSYRHLHRGFLYWWAQDKVSGIILILIMLLNVVIFDLNEIVIKCLASICAITIVAVMIRSWYLGYIKLKKIENVDLILTTYRGELLKVFLVSLAFSSFPIYMGWFELEISHAMAIVIPLTYILAVYHVYIELKFNDLTSNRTIGI